MHNLKTTYTLLASLFVTTLFLACDEDFNTLESSIDVNDNFNTALQKYAIKAYSKKLEPVQTNNLPINAIGVYKDGYGTTTSSVVSQVALSADNSTIPDNTVFDSIVLSIPYFSSLTSTDSDGNSTFELDSILGNNPIRLSIFRSNYFLRNFTVDDEFNNNLEYFSDKTNSEGSTIAPSDLEGELLYQNINFLPDPRQVKTFDEEGEITARGNPALRVRLDALASLPDNYWETVILDKQGEPELSNTNNFNNYFRGFYIKAEAANTIGDGTLMLLNTAQANVTIYYSVLLDRDDDDDDGIPNFADVDIDGDTVNDNGEDTDGDGINDATDVDQVSEGIDENINGIDDDAEEDDTDTFLINFGGTSVNFLNNPFTLPVDSGNIQDGDAALYLKGGEGSMAVLELFDDNLEGNSTEDFIADFRGDDIENPKRLINEAFLNIYVNQDFIEGEEPDRIYIYDIKNEIPLIDYFLDQSFANSPIESKQIHLEPLERENDKGVRYKIRITEHLNNIVLRDSTNFKLGLVVSKSVGIENDTSLNFSVDTDDEDFDYIPISSIISPRGTVLFGTTAEVPEDKRIELEIYYTEPEFNSEN